MAVPNSNSIHFSGVKNGEVSGRAKDFENKLNPPCFGGEVLLCDVAMIHNLATEDGLGWALFRAFFE